MGHARLVSFMQGGDMGDTVEVVTEELHEYLLIKWQLLICYERAKKLSGWLLGRWPLTPIWC